MSLTETQKSQIRTAVRELFNNYSSNYLPGWEVESFVDRIDEVTSFRAENEVQVLLYNHANPYISVLRALFQADRKVQAILMLRRISADSKSLDCAVGLYDAKAVVEAYWQRFERETPYHAPHGT